MSRTLCLIGFVAALVALSEPSYGQSGGGYVIVRGVVGSGSAPIGGGTYTLGSSVGQPALGILSGGGYALTGGTWSAGGIPPTGSMEGGAVCSGGSNDGGACSMNADCPGGACELKSRYLSMTSPVAVGGDPVSIRVTLVNLDDGLGFDDREGQVWWAGPSQAIGNAPDAAMTGAAVLCEASPSTAQVWPAGVFHLFGAPVIPGSVYEVRTCDAAGTNCSGPLTVDTGKWGDAVAVFGGSSQPNFADINAIVGKFQGSESAPDMSLADLRGSGANGAPNTPDQTANFLDINADVGAFQGDAYPFTVPACP